MGDQAREVFGAFEDQHRAAPFSVNSKAILHGIVQFAEFLFKESRFENVPVCDKIRGAFEETQELKPLVQKRTGHPKNWLDIEAATRR